MTISLGCSQRQDRDQDSQKELLFIKKNHREEVNGLRNQIANYGLTEELDALISQDLSKIMTDIWEQYDKLAQKN